MPMKSAEAWVLWWNEESGFDFEDPRNFPDFVRAIQADTARSQREADAGIARTVDVETLSVASGEPNTGSFVAALIESAAPRVRQGETVTAAEWYDTFMHRQDLAGRIGIDELAEVMDASRAEALEDVTTILAGHKTCGLPCDCVDVALDEVRDLAASPKPRGER